MDPMRKVLSSFMLDVNDYLNFVSDFGKPNFKYFNFVLNKMGLLYIFLIKNEIFTYNKVSMQFIDGVFTALKKKFISEKSLINRSAIIFLMSKIYFTDDIANLMKLRITSEEWSEFTLFVDKIKDMTEFESIRVMFYHLFAENIFRFTIKNKVLALDFGMPDNEMSGDNETSNNEIFRKEILQEINVLERTDVWNLIQLSKIRNEVMKPFEKMFPDKPQLESVLEDFQLVKALIKNPESRSKPRVLLKKEAPPTNQNILRPSGSAAAVVKYEDMELDSDFDLEADPTFSKASKSNKKSTSSYRVKTKRKIPPALINDSDSSDSEGDQNFKKMTRCLGFETQNVMKGLGVGCFSKKLDKCYGEIKTEKK